jgi:hypothetical protein
MIAATVAITAMSLLFVVFGLLAAVDEKCDGNCPGCPAAGRVGAGACEHPTEGGPHGP